MVPDSQRIIIGTDGGLSVEPDLLLKALERETSAQLDDDDRTIAASHLETVLYAGSTRLLRRGGLSRRVGEGRYLAVGDLGTLGLAVLLGPVLHLVAAGVALKSARKLLQFDRAWRPRLVALYVELQGVEREVFEAIHDLQTRWTVTNYDALDAGDYDAAFGQVAPTAGEVREALERPAADVDDAIATLVQRRILAGEDGRYWIRF